MTYQPQAVRSPRDPLPTMYDLPSEDPEELGLPDEFHEFQPQLLRETFRSPNYPEEQVLVATDLNLYYDPLHPLRYKRPDWFVVLGVERAATQEDLRWSYLIWQEGVSPYLVVELLSPGTESEDLGQTLRDAAKPPPKWEVYERHLRVPYYVVFDRYTNNFRAFRLVGTRYEALVIEASRLWFEEIGLGLVMWQGDYEGVEGQWLRWYDGSGGLILTRSEQAEAERQRAEAERQRADGLAEENDRMAAKLRELGIDLDSGTSQP